MFFHWGNNSWDDDIPSMLGVSRIIGWKVVLTYAVLAMIVAIISGLIYLC